MLPRPARIGPLELGAVPWVVGVVRSPRSLDLLAGTVPEFDLVEVRVDLLGGDVDWRGPVRRLRELGVPAILTARHESEGGAWTRGEGAREALLRASLADIAAVDIELATAWLPSFLPAARAAGVAVIGSFHDFGATPGAAGLGAVVARGRLLGVDVVKLATLAREPGDLQRLKELPGRNPDLRLCLLGVGPLGPASRVEFPLAGSCLTYGFADEESAPGQLAAGELRRRLAAAHAGYRAAIAGR